MKCCTYPELVNQASMHLVRQLLSSVVYKRVISLVLVSQALENRLPVASGSTGDTFRDKSHKGSDARYIPLLQGILRMESQSQMKM